MLCCSLYGFSLSKPFHVALFPKRWSCWICTTDTPHWREPGGCWHEKAGKLRVPFGQGSWLVSAVGQEQVAKRTTVCVDMDLESGRSSPEWWEVPGSAMLLIHVTPCAASPAPTPSSATPPQNFCSTTQMLSPGPGWREEVELCFVAVSWFLFQFNSQACWFLAVPLRFFKATAGF